MESDVRLKDILERHFVTKLLRDSMSVFNMFGVH